MQAPTTNVIFVQLNTMQEKEIINQGLLESKKKFGS